uniref:FecR domain-containing protein n=1 Tax=Barnesiella intestinihominis TaxID=487174 RepID=UPI003FD7781A
LLDGSVAFCYPSTTDQEMKCILSPGEQVYYNRTTHNLEKKNFILSDYSSWKDGKYYFKNETLENIAKQLERNFDVNILSAMNLDGYLTIKRDGKIIEIY